MPRATQVKKKKQRRRLRRAANKRRCKFTPPGADSPGRWDLWPIDYKNLDLLQKFTTSQGKIYSRKRSGNSAKAQTRMKQAIKMARYMALMPYVGE